MARHSYRFECPILDRRFHRRAGWGAFLGGAFTYILADLIRPGDENSPPP